MSRVTKDKKNWVFCNNFALVTDYKREERKTRSKNQTHTHFSCGLSSQLLSPGLTPDFLVSESSDNHTQSPFGLPVPPAVES